MTMTRRHFLLTAATVPAVIATGSGVLAAVSPAARSYQIGVYDPAQEFNRDPRLGIEHIFVSWLDFDAKAFAAADKAASRLNRELLVSVEPWSREGTGADVATRHLAAISAGKYDAEIKVIGTAIAATGRPALVRFGQEMDDVSGRYPWAGQPSPAFVDAYRHFVARMRELAPKVEFVWTPKGDGDTVGYYPGDDVTDYVGFTLFNLQAHDINQFGRRVSLREHVARKYRFVARYNKPVVIAEAGVSGDVSYRRAWLGAMANLHDTFPMLRAVVYFNRRETFAWPEPYGRPDWRIKANEI